MKMIYRVIIFGLCFCSQKTATGQIITLVNKDDVTCMVPVHFAVKTGSAVIKSIFNISDGEKISAHVGSQSSVTLHLINITNTHQLDLPFTTPGYQHFIVSVENDTTTIFINGTPIAVIDFATLGVTVEGGDLIFLEQFDCNMIIIPGCKTPCAEIDFMYFNNSVKINISEKNYNELLEINLDQNITTLDIGEQCLRNMEVNKEMRLSLPKSFSGVSSINVKKDKDNVLTISSPHRSLLKDICNNIDIKNYTETNTTSCPPGNLGHLCNTICHSIHESECPYCKYPEICKNSNSSCSWEDRQLFCSEDCDRKTWGHFCENNCSGCENCDKLTGNCPKKSEGLDGNLVVAIIIGVVFFVAVCLAGFCCWKHRNFWQRYCRVLGRVICRSSSDEENAIERTDPPNPKDEFQRFLDQPI